MEKNNAIEFINISKSFGSIKANRDISFEVQKGTIHALIGENGAGKSTLMSILFGLYEPDEGIIKVNNNEVLIKGPNDANRLGIGMVHQHFKLVDVYTNLENIVLGDEDINNVTRVINYKPAIKKIQTIQEMFNLQFDLNRMTGKETVATQQKVEIMKMLYRDSQILIFDEPTAVLTDQEIQGLLETFKLFREQGKTILFISHKLAEIKEVADNATVLRHGQVTGNFKVADVSISEMANRMVGGEVEIARNEYSDTSKNEVIFSLKNVSTDGEKPLRNVSLDVRSGEIVAIAGVEGNGQHDLEHVASGMIKPIAGEVLLKKTDLIKEKFEKVQKAKKKRNIILSLATILFIYIALVLFFVPSVDLSSKVIYQILGGFFILFGVITLGIVFTNLYGAKLRTLNLNVIGHFEQDITKKQKNILKYTFLSGIASAALSFMFSFSFINADMTGISIMIFFAALSIVLFMTNMVYVFANKTLSHKFATKKNMSAIFSQEAVAILTLVGTIVVGSYAITKNMLSIMQVTGILAVVLSAIALILVFSITLTYFTITETVEKDSEDSDFIRISDLSVKQISEIGFSFIPSDRHKHGLALDYSIKDNTILRRLWDKTYQKLGIINKKNVKKETDEIIEKYDVRGARKGYSISRSLSGGNQQKFIVGREMNSPHDFILILQPTRGLDVGAIKNIHERILEEKKNGKAILLISYELDEVLALADKIAVINTGEILAVKEAKNLTRTEIGIYMAHKKSDDEKGGK
ncbi:ATP-binding cassette domain-containing protein [Mycoplasma sp. Z663]|uniref:ATP-binding cassette domain-containing protein n=1 Tax=Mycoplasma sp. Z663 TaxID=3401686 RepID=UPI003AB02E1A